MTEKWIAFYVSSHGFGHMTRSLAIIEELIEKTNYGIYLASGKYQNDFARDYLAAYGERIYFRDVQTDVGLVTPEHRLSVDIQETESQLQRFIDSWETIVAAEVKQLNSFEIECVLSDISPIGALVGKELEVQTIGISNFTWVEQYQYYKFSPAVINRFISAYANFDFFIEYELALPTESVMTPKEKIGFVARDLDWKKISELKQFYGNSIFISSGKAVQIDNIHIEKFNGTIFTTSGVTVTGSDKVVQLPTNVLDTQNYIAASQLVITKAGWGTIAEGITANKKMVFIEREGVLEDTYNISRLKDNHMAMSIKEEELQSLDIFRLEQKADQLISYDRLNQYTNQKEQILDLLNLSRYTKAE